MVRDSPSGSPPTPTLGLALERLCHHKLQRYDVAHNDAQHRTHRHLHRCVPKHLAQPPRVLRGWAGRSGGWVEDGLGGRCVGGGCGGGVDAGGAQHAGASDSKGVCIGRASWVNGWRGDDMCVLEWVGWGTDLAQRCQQACAWVRWWEAALVRSQAGACTRAARPLRGWGWGRGGGGSTIWQNNTNKQCDAFAGGTVCLTSRCPSPQYGSSGGASGVQGPFHGEGMYMYVASSAPLQTTLRLCQGPGPPFRPRPGLPVLGGRPAFR